MDLPFFQELKRRNVFRVVIGYVVLAWLMAQVAEFLLEAFGAPGWVLKTLVALFLIGLPFVIYFAWAFELTPEGVKREREVDRKQQIMGSSGRTLDRAIIVLLLLALAWFAWDRYGPEDSGSQVAIVGETAAPADFAAPPSDGELPIVAVLPFKATGSDDGGFLAAGLHDDLLTRLAKLGAFRVISRTSMMEYADTTKNMRQIGEELGAGYILEGGVQSRGSRIRINAQLIDAPDDEHLWAEIYDRELTADDLFEIQSELAVAITGALHTVLSPDDRALIDDIPTRNLDAYNAYLRGLQRRDEGRGSVGGPQDRKAVEDFEEAVRLDPGFAEAWAQLALVQSRMSFGSKDSEHEIAALSALEQARELKPGLLETEIARAEYMYRVLNEYQQALQVLEALGERAEGDTYVLSLKAWLERRLGGYEDGYRTLQQALKLSPRNVTTLILSSHFATLVDDCEAAARHAQAAFSLAPEVQDVRAYLAQYELECNGDYARAGDLLRKFDFTQGAVGWGIALDSAFSEGNAQRAFSLIEAQVYFSDRLWPVFRSLIQAGVYRYLNQDEAAATNAIDTAGEFLTVAANDEDLLDGAPYAQLMQFYAAMRNDADATRHWIEEHKRRYREEFKGDKFEESRFRLRYASNLAMAGLYDEAVEELRIMVEEPGGHRFPYFHGLPEFEVLHDHPGYSQLRAKYGNHDSAPTE